MDHSGTELLQRARRLIHSGFGAHMPGPLAGVRVLDLTSVVSGPLATMFLADQGAKVIKIEPLGGDITRHSGQSVSSSGEFSALFVSTNRGKPPPRGDRASPRTRGSTRPPAARSMPPSGFC